MNDALCDERRVLGTERRYLLNLLSSKDLEIERLMRVYTHREETEENLRRCLAENKGFAERYAHLVDLFNQMSSEYEGLRCQLKEARRENMSMIPIVHVVFAFWAVLSLNQNANRKISLQAWECRLRVRQRVIFHEWVNLSKIRQCLKREGLERLVSPINKRIGACIRGLFVYSVRRRHWTFTAGNRLIDALKSPLIRFFRALTSSPKRTRLGATVLRTWTRCIQSKVKRCTLLSEFRFLKKRINSDNLMELFSRHRKLKILQYLHSFVVITKAPPSPSLPETDSMGALVSCIALRDVLLSHHKGELLHVLQRFRPYSLSDSLIAKRMMFSWYTYVSHLARQRDALLTAFIVRNQYRILLRFFRGFRVSVSKPKAVSRIAQLIRRRLLNVWEFMIPIREQVKRKLEFFSIRHCNFFPQREICLTSFATKRIFYTSKQIVRKNFAILRSVSSDKPFQDILFLEAIRRVVNVIRLREKHLLLHAFNELWHNILRKDNLELAMIADRNSRLNRRVAGVQTEGDIDQELDAYADIAFELEQQLNLSEARNADLQESLSKLKENYSLLLLSRPVSFRDG